MTGREGRSLPAEAPGVGGEAGPRAEAEGGPVSGAPRSPAGVAAPRDYAGVVGFPEQLLLRPIGVMRSPYRERHGTPRQGALDDQPAPEAEGFVELLPHVDPDALQDLDGFARLWLLSWMHLNNPAWSALVRPPRGGVKRGVFATRSPHRPNPIALSCVQFVGREGGRVAVRGHDLIDGTPILDIKPYIPFADAFPDSAAGWVDALPRGPDGRPLGPRLKRA